ncbi:glycosyltransferase [Salinimicrobium sp. WS361]|uniref:glycosyltransferase n=1 Tax=Salinimicrobium sp. WS361 TaxID=3425123 RepID=UPI003D6F1302
MKNILFITHNTSRTGAPLVLLYFLQWLKVNKPEIRISLLNLQDGPLNENFKNNSDEYFELSNYKMQGKSLLEIVIHRIFKKTGFVQKSANKQDILFKELSLKNFDLIYANTVVSLPIACKIKEFNKDMNLILHQHELELAVKSLVPDFEKLVLNVDHFISASNKVKVFLEDNYNIDCSKIKTVYEFVPQKKKKIFQKSSFTVGGAGTVEWRKGVDLFLQVSAFIKINYPDYKINFQWAGKMSKTDEYKLNFDIRRAGLSESVTFTNEYSKPEEIFQDFDVFLMTSREDPFPLVCIEAGMMGIPIICFKGATGTEEILLNGGGKIVPYLDIKEMAMQIIEYFNHPKQIVIDGERAIASFSEFNPYVQAPKIFEEIKSF